MRKINKTTLGKLGMLSLITNVPSANEPINLSAPSEFNKLTQINAASLVAGGIRLVLVAAAIIFFFVLVIGGIQWIVSGGDKTGAENARKRITNALIGLAIVFVAWAIVSLINSLFGINILSLNIPTLFKP